METIKGWKRSSIFAKIYCWFYCLRKSDIPDNLCPYWWRSVFMYFVIVPYTLLVLPIVIIEVFTKERSDTTWQRLGFTFLIYLFLFAGWSMLFLPYQIYTWGFVEMTGIWNVLFMMGLVLWLIGIIYGTWELAKFLIVMMFRGVQSAIDNVSPPGVKKKSVMVVEFIKAKYHKYCPKIEWED